MSGKVVIGAELQLQTAQSLENVGKVKQALKEAQKALNSAQSEFGEFSKEAVNAAKQVANLKDRLGDAANLVDAFNPDQKFKAWTNSLNGVVGGFAAVQGVMGLVGSESEDVQKALLKVQSAMAMMQGVDAVLDSVQSFKSLAIVIKSSTVFQQAHNVVTAIATTLMKAFGVATVTTGAGFKALKVAIAATGIGLLVVGIGLLISKIMDWIDSTDEAEAAQNRLTASIERSNAALERNLARIQFNTNKRVLLAKIAGKSEAEQRAITLEGMQLEAEKLEADIIRKKQHAIELAKIEGIKQEDLNNANKARQEAQDKYNKQLNEMELFNLQGQADTATKARDKAKQDAEKHNQALLEQQKRYNEKRKELMSIGVVDLDKGVEDYNKQQMELEAKRLEELQAVANQKAMIHEGVANHLAGIQAKITENEKAGAEARKKIAQLEYEHKQNMMYLTSDALGAFGELAGRSTAVGKGMAVAATTISTIQAAQDAYRNQMTIPDPSSQFRAILAAAAATAFGLAKVKAIIGVKVPNAASISSPSIQGGGASAPITPGLSNSVTRLDRDTINNLGNQAIKAFVVETDVTTNQEKIARINRAARIG